MKNETDCDPTPEVVQEHARRRDERTARFEAALTEIRDILPIQNDEYARRVFRIAANALEPE